MADPVSELKVVIGADSGQLVAELGRADKALGKSADNFAVAMKAATVLAGAAAAAGAAMAAMVKSATDNADAMGKMAQGAGVATKEFTELVYAARLSDVSAEQLSTSLGRLNRNIADTAAGTGEAKDAFSALGIQVKNADGTLKNADQIMMEVAGQFAQMDDGAHKSALAIQIFGRAGAAMIPMLNAGAEGLRQMRDEANALGVTIDSKTAKAAEQFNDQLTRLGQVQQGLANSLMAELLPAMNQIVDAMVDGAKEGGGMQSQMKGLADGIKGSALVVFQTLAVLGSDVAFVFKGIGTEVGGIAAQLSALASGDFKAFSAIGQMMKADAALARQELDDFQRRIMNLGVAGGAGDGADNFDLQGRGGGGGGITDKTGADKKRKATSLFGQQLQEGMDEEMKLMAEIAQIVTDYRAKEREAEQENYDLRNKALIEFYDRQQEEAIRAGEEEIKIAQKTQTALQKFERKGYQERAKQIFEELDNITAGVSQHSRAMFNINKVAGIANAVINAYTGISKTMSAYPYPWNIAMAAAHGVAAFAQVNAIRSQSFDGGGGGAAPSLAGATAAPPVTPVGGTGVTAGGSSNTLDQTITVQGINENELFSGGRMRGLIENLLEAQRNGARVVLAS